jgi:hypothetical protein
MAATIAKLSVQTLPRKAKAKTTKMRGQTGAAISVGSIAMVLTGLSLNHLAHGIELVTNSPSIESWSMGVGIDLGFVSLELAQIMATTEKLRKLISRYTRPAIMGTLVGSAAMNAFAFAAQSIGWKTYAAAVLGLAIPSLIYAMTRIAAAMWMDCHIKA